MSERSFNKYQKFAPSLMSKTLNKFSLIATQNQNSANRFIQLGALNNVVNVGNIKFDQDYQADKSSIQELKKIINNKMVITFASTHEGEERQILNSFLQVKDKINALLIIVPRHPERFNAVEKLAKNLNLTIERRSGAKSAIKSQILLGDSMGEMMSYFAVSDIVFMGGSLSNTGGHNMLEPASISKPIIFGQNVFNFAEISSDLLLQQGAIQVQNADELFEKIITLINDKEQRKTLGDNAKQYFNSQQGAVKKLSKLIDEIF
jgi:3-deoxy-D-manno-octulosonic-acid transferase